MVNKKVSGHKQSRSTEVIKSISYSQDEILKNIMSLEGISRFHLDTCYSKGNFYKNISGPEIKIDIKPQSDDVLCLDVCKLPFKDGSISSIVFDPPFIAGGDGDSKMAKRFSSFDSVREMWDFFRDSIHELNRVLKNQGVLVIKCQDMVNARNQYLSHYEIISLCIQEKLYPKDVYILLAKSRLLRGNLKKQSHARKFHCYFLVFKKSKRNIGYSTFQMQGEKTPNLSVQGDKPNDTVLPGGLRE